MSRRIACYLALVGLVCCRQLAAEDQTPPSGGQPSPEALEHFERRVRPVFLQHCAECHGADSQEAGLRLDNRTAVERGGDSGKVVVPGNPDDSLLVKLIRYDGKVQMPPDGKLPDDAIAALTKWISQGAPWPNDATAPAGDAAAPANKTIDYAAVAASHWAFQPVVAPQIPPVQNTGWIRTPVDAFVLAKLEAAGLSPSPAVDRRTLIRRLTFDLIGLPPTYDEVKAFVADPSPNAVEQLVDRLLASPRYGERWGRLWLDLARYSDTKGYVGADTGDIIRREYPFAYAYRDWVIQAFNDDLPYDQFLKQQIAADRLTDNPDDPSLAALGFFRVGRVFLGNKPDQIDDKIDVLSRGTLGLTVACARCHDHKFEPIATADYYALYGVFNSTEEQDDTVRRRMLLADRNDAGDAHIFLRGNPNRHGDKVPRQFLPVLSQGPPQPFTDGSGRRELAEKIAARDNPLTARVWINRVWGHHFDVPLVDTPSDFGVRTAPPVQRDLLDYLADRFMAEGWSLKKLHRWIVLSNTYQQASDQRPECVAVDSENRLLWRTTRRRLDFEQFRDALLQASNALDVTQGGPSVEISQPPFSRRRTVYARIDRQNLPGLFRAFDFANPDAHSPGRFQTSVPQQGLFLLNDPFMVKCAAELANLLDLAEVAEESARVQRLYRQALARDPSPDELQQALTFVRSQPDATAAPNPDPAAAEFGPWKRLAQALLMSNEFSFID